MLSYSSLIAGVVAVRGRRIFRGATGGRCDFGGYEDIDVEVDEVEYTDAEDARDTVDLFVDEDCAEL